MPDTDGDLLTDGFEWHYGLDPKVANSIEDDDDVDGLGNLDEQIYCTDPSNPDSDGDGTNDGDEVEQGSEPNEPADGGQPDSGAGSAEVELKSERTKYCMLTFYTPKKPNRFSRRSQRQSLGEVHPSRGQHLPPESGLR